MNSLLDVDQLRTFLAIVETGSFTRAAEIVHKTQSAVSMQMKRLEERLERPIFARDGRASKLTEDGDRLLDYARRIVKLTVEALAAFSDFALTGRVRLGVPDDYADRYLPEIMARFSRAYPGVELSVICEPSLELVERIAENELDLAIITDCESAASACSGSAPTATRRIARNRCRSRSDARPANGGRRRSNASSAWAGPTACCTRVGTPARSRPPCSPGSRSRYFRNPACGRACACSARPTVLRNCPPAGSDCCAIRTSNRRSPRRLPNTSSPRSTIYPQRPTRRSRQGSEISNQKGATLDSLHFLSLPGRNSHKSTDSSPRMSASGLKPDGLPLSRKVAEVPTAVMKGTQHPADFRSP